MFILPTQMRDVSPSAGLLFSQLSFTFFITDDFNTMADISFYAAYLSVVPCSIEHTKFSQTFPESEPVLVHGLFAKYHC